MYTVETPSDPDTNGTEESVHISEVYIHARAVLGERKGVLIREVSSFVGVLRRERFHCMCTNFMFTLKIDWKLSLSHANCLVAIMYFM